ncbi:MAG: prephenate dehydrogenase/arogenate dehydrogenase family protein, partial [Acidobacteriia bacterium]|nr:prephenate dehydrogenase/arogenate dehydrogenase family protein [Terriglobia bacterium]
GFAELFADRFCILTPPPGTDTKAVEKIAALWRRAGMKIEIMDAHQAVSQLCSNSIISALIYTIEKNRKSCFAA